MGQAQGLIGIAVLIGLAWLISEKRSRFPLRLVLGGIALQFALAFLLLRFPLIATPFEYLARGVNGVIQRADAGIVFIFGPELADPGGPWGFVFLVKVLPVIIFFASLMAVLYHWGIMQRIISLLASLLRSTLGVSGAEAMAMAANVFVGQTEAPLCIKPIVPRMTRAQLATLMVGGFSTMAGSVLFAYVGLLGGGDEAREVEVIKHLLTASLMSAPAAFVMARVIVPETEDQPDESVEALSAEQREPEEPKLERNVLDAAAEGAGDGLRLALNVGAMLIAFVSLLALANWPIQAAGDIPAIAEWREANGIGPFSLEAAIGWALAPLAWAMGVVWTDAPFVGSLLGQKLIATEFYAYSVLSEGRDGLEPRSVVISTYALCGFANFPSIAIQIGGLSAIAPTRRREFAGLGIRAMIGGALASWSTASIAGLFL